MGQLRDDFLFESGIAGLTVLFVLADVNANLEAFNYVTLFI